MEAHNLSLICRAHQVVEDGYEFFNRRQVIVYTYSTNVYKFRNSSGYRVGSAITVIAPAAGDNL